MQIKPMSQGSGVPAGSVGEAKTPTSKLAAAKAAFLGQPLPQPEQASSGDPQADRIQNIRRIKMKTNFSPDRPIETMEQTPVEALPAEAASNESAISDPSSNEQVEQATEETKPLSPQFAALAKQKRALQVKERELADREAALTKSAPNPDEFVSKADLIANPLKIFETGVTYDQLTEAILASQSGTGSHEIQELKAEIKALKEGVDRNLSERDQQAEQQVLASFQREADKLAFSGDEFELVRETKSTPKVVELIHRTWKESGEILDVQEAMQLVEEELLNESLTIANYKKIQSRLASADQPKQPQPQDTRQIRTLTNRDNARPQMDRRARAIAAMQGTLKR